MGDEVIHRDDLVRLERGEDAARDRERSAPGVARPRRSPAMPKESRREQRSSTTSSTLCRAARAARARCRPRLDRREERGAARRRRALPRAQPTTLLAANADDVDGAARPATRRRSSTA